MPRLLPLLLFCCLMACRPSKSDPSHQLLGKWKVVDCQIDSEELSPALVAGAIEEIRSSVYTFSEGGVLALDAPANDEHVRGRWDFDPEAQSLSLTHEYEKASTQEAYRVEKVSDKSLLLHQDMGELGQMLLRLEKQ